MSRTYRKQRVRPVLNDEWWKKCSGRYRGYVNDGKQFWQCRCDRCVGSKLHKHERKQFALHWELEAVNYSPEID